MIGRILSWLLLPLLALVLWAWLAVQGFWGERQGMGEVTDQRRQPATLEAQHKSILFGDLHVHTTYSFDAFSISLPMYQGEGVHPPADACDYARFCSSLDFWSINDHAEGMTPAQWSQTRDMVRQCNAAAGDTDDIGPLPRSERV